MDNPIAGYLYTLVTISVTFAGFAALLAMLRQLIGGQFRGYDIFFVQSVLMRSLIVIVCALLPPLLAAFAMSPSTVWRWSSLAAAVLIGLFTLVWPTIVRGMVTATPMSKVSRGYFLLQALTAIFLLTVALGVFAEPVDGHYAAGLTVFMVINWISVLLSLQLLFAGPSRKGRR